MVLRAKGIRARGRAGRAGGGRGVARPQKQDDGIPSVYKEMLRDDAGDTAASTVDDGSRPRKRPRRAGERMQRAPETEETRQRLAQPIVEVESSPPPPQKPQQIIVDDSESDLEFEDIEFGGNSTADDDEALPEPMKGQEEGFSVLVKQAGQNTPARAERKRRQVTWAGREVRLAIHKVHILYLLYHVFYRNHWCSDDVVRAIVKPLVPPRIVQLLNPDPRASQAQSSSFFLLGLNQICDFFHGRFKITSLGMRRPHWLAEKADLANFKLDDRTEKPLELSDFRRAAKSMQGSADVGAQLFCCLLRALGVETRLVCSLQPLGFASAAEVGPGANTTPVKKTVYLRDPIETPKSSTNAMDGTTETIATQTSRRITRIGQPRSTALPLVSQASPSLSNESTRIERPSYPVLWVEAFNAAHQKWIVVDPLATHTVAKPSRLEPGINDPKNCMTYAVAFEENGVVRDVTRRYTKAYTAKTRRIRVESTEHGTAWFRKALRLFRRPGRALDRDTLEDVELTAKEASEGMPKNVQDFKNHPLYALVRHLRRNEIIHPKTESGRINVGTANNPKFENVYRRNNVHIVKSADKWFRLGREIKMGEQPLKHAMPRRGTRVRELPLGGEREGVQDVGVGLYAVFQTQLYNPPPVVNGKIPKNQYGNIDIYVPSMIPEAAVWVRMPEAKHAAKTLKIDYADAVTGFDFKGRHGTARLDGVVVAEEYHEAMEVVCDALREMSAEERKDDRKREVLRLWKRFLVGMREIDRIDGYLKNEDGDSQKHVEPIPPRYDEEIGGYLADDVDGRPTQASTRRRAAADPGGGFFAESDEDTDGGGGFLAESNDDTGDEGGFVPEEETVTEDDIDDSDADNDHGGFVPHRDDDRSPLVPTQEIENLLPKVDGTNETEAEVEYPDANPFGFANIRIPALMRVASIADGSRASGLPGIVRSMKRPQLKFLAEEPIMVDENMMPTHLRINRPIEQLATATHTNPKTAPDTMPINVEPAVPTIEQEQSQPQMNKPEFMSVGNTEIDLAVEPEAPEKSKTKSAMHKDELPVSSYEYDEDMLDEDPEDEDAEPEWLL